MARLCWNKNESWLTLVGAREVGFGEGLGPFEEI